jgi:hypothetical protein
MNALHMLLLSSSCAVIACGTPPVIPLPPTRAVAPLSEEEPLPRAHDHRTVTVGDAQWTLVDVAAARQSRSGSVTVLVSLDVTNLSEEPMRLRLTPVCVDDSGASTPVLDPVDPRAPVAHETLFDGAEIASRRSRRVRWLCELQRGRSLSALVLPGWSAIDGTVELRATSSSL